MVLSTRELFILQRAKIINTLFWICVAIFATYFILKSLKHPEVINNEKKKKKAYFSASCYFDTCTFSDCIKVGLDYISKRYL